jgi:hypothetical protein
MEPPGAARCRPVPGVPGVPPGAARCRPVPSGAVRCRPVPPGAARCRPVPSGAVRCRVPSDALETEHPTSGLCLPPNTV